nr:essential structural protein pp78/81 [Spodoptera littoralis nucleopolyhedrovirus]
MAATLDELFKANNYNVDLKLLMSRLVTPSPCVELKRKLISVSPQSKVVNLDIYECMQLLRIADDMYEDKVSVRPALSESLLNKIIQIDRAIDAVQCDRQYELAMKKHIDLAKESHDPVQVNKHLERVLSLLKLAVSTPPSPVGIENTIDEILTTAAATTEPKQSSQEQPIEPPSKPSKEQSLSKPIEPSILPEPLSKPIQEQSLSKPIEPSILPEPPIPSPNEFSTIEPSILPTQILPPPPPPLPQSIMPPPPPIMPPPPPPPPPPQSILPTDQQLITVPPTEARNLLLEQIKQKPSLRPIEPAAPKPKDTRNLLLEQIKQRPTLRKITPPPSQASLSNVESTPMGAILSRRIGIKPSSSSSEIETETEPSSWLDEEEDPRRIKFVSKSHTTQIGDNENIGREEIAEREMYNRIKAETIASSVIAESSEVIRNNAADILRDLNNVKNIVAKDDALRLIDNVERTMSIVQIMFGDAESALAVEQANGDQADTMSKDRFVRAVEHFIVNDDIAKAKSMLQKRGDGDQDEKISQLRRRVDELSRLSSSQI